VEETEGIADIAEFSLYVQFVGLFLEKPLSARSPELSSQSPLQPQHVVASMNLSTNSSSAQLEVNSFDGFFKASTAPEKASATHGNGEAIDA
jgi:hypothetical protein